MKRTARVFCALWQCAWGLPQTLVGFFVWLGCRLRGRKSYWLGGAVCTEWKRQDGVSLGLFFFCPENGGIHLHEYGHTFQSLMLGPLYPILVLAPSLVWAGLPAFDRMRKKRKLPYSALYCERWADRLGGRYKIARTSGRRAELVKK